MNHRIKFFQTMKFALLSAAFAAAWTATAAPVAPTNATPQVARSVFIQPASPKEGRDPFFPGSTRPYVSQAPAISSAATDLSSLVMQGITGPPGHRLAIINNVTFGVGDDAMVRTPQGGRIQIHCLEISADSAVIEADGQRHELHYGEKP
jgi:hypothetical protein